MLISHQHLEIALSGTEQYDMRGDSVKTTHEPRASFFFRGMSMYPFIRPGDLIDVLPVRAGEVKPRQVLVFQKPYGQGLAAHRVLRVTRNIHGRYVFFTQGDGSPAPDPAVADSLLIGRVAAITRNGKTQHVSPLREHTSFFLGKLYWRLKTVFSKPLRCMLHFASPVLPLESAVFKTSSGTVRKFFLFGRTIVERPCTEIQRTARHAPASRSKPDVQPQTMIKMKVSTGADS